MKCRTRVIFGMVVVALVVLWVAGSAVAGSPRQAPQAQGTLTTAVESQFPLYPSMPSRMPYQGVLRDSEGNLVSGTRDLTLTVYSYSLLPLPGRWTEVYSETQHDVAVTNGLFNVLVGQVNPLDADIFDGIWFAGGSLELGVKVDGGTELRPRTKLLPVPYAYRAHYVNQHPAPSYDSGWRSIGIRPDPGYEQFDHNLGGDVDDYVVDLQCKYRGTIYQVRESRAYVQQIRTDRVRVWVQGGTDPDAIRVRIWRIK